MYDGDDVRKPLAPLRSHAINATYDGTLNGEKRYMLLHFVQDKLRGEERYTSGTTPTSLRYTGQRIETDLCTTSNPLQIPGIC